MQRGCFVNNSFWKRARARGPPHPRGLLAVRGTPHLCMLAIYRLWTRRMMWDRPASGCSLLVHAARSMRKVFSTHVWTKQTCTLKASLGLSLSVPASVSSYMSLTTIQLNRKVGRAISVRACSDVTNKDAAAPFCEAI
jgi:hypothetical protein